MSDVWRPAVKPRTVAGAVVQTERAHLVNEVAHRVETGDVTLRVLPDGDTTARKRSCIISEALAAVDEANRRLEKLAGDGYPAERLDPAAYLVGRLILAGAWRIHRLHPDDGGEPTPLVPERRQAVGEWQVTLLSDGHLEARYLAGDQ